MPVLLTGVGRVAVSGQSRSPLSQQVRNLVACSPLRCRRRRPPDAQGCVRLGRPGVPGSDASPDTMSPAVAVTSAATGLDSWPSAAPSEPWTIGSTAVSRPVIAVSTDRATVATAESTFVVTPSTIPPTLRASVRGNVPPRGAASARGEPVAGVVPPVPVTRPGDADGEAGVPASAGAGGAFRRDPVVPVVPGRVRCRSPECVRRGFGAVVDARAGSVGIAATGAGPAGSGRPDATLVEASTTGWGARAP